jgi:phenylalanyl-tRNA synthetase beta chain
MKASYNWLRDYCDFGLPPHELAERLSHAGVKVDSFEQRGDDWALEVEVKSNRADCLCHLGLAREVAAVTGTAMRTPAIEPPRGGDERFEQWATVEVTAPDLCPHYTARVITGVKVAPSPDWLRARLETCGIRPVNNVVDATNYVMLECGQPLHAFDLSLIGKRHIIVRRARAGETLTAIDGSKHELTGEECVIADHFKPIALAGIMGGLESEIRDSTADLLLESARFDPRNNRRTSRRHALASDSSYRYQRGVDPEVTDWASRRACALIQQLTGGTVAAGSADLRADSTPTPEVRLRLARLALVLGLELPRKEVCRIFSSLGLQVVPEEADSVAVRVPSWRADLRREVDLIEEVARIHGYDKIRETTAMPVRSAAPSIGEVAERKARHLVAGHGFNEVMTYSLVAPTPLQRSQPWHDGEPLHVRNPVTVDRTHLRLTNMANLLLVKQFNAARGARQVNLFELGRIYLPRHGRAQPDRDTPREKLCLSLLTDSQDGVRLLKGVLANVLLELGIEDELNEKPGARGPFLPDESVELRLSGEFLGCAGTAAPEVAEGLELRGRPALMEVDFHLLSARCRLDRPYRPVPVYPSTSRDLAIVVDEAVLWADIDACIRRSAPEALESVELFDVYRGRPVPEGRKSIAFSLTLRRADRTITAAEAEEARAAILAALERELRAELR